MGSFWVMAIDTYVLEIVPRDFSAIFPIFVCVTS